MVFVVEIITCLDTGEYSLIDTHLYARQYSKANFKIGFHLIINFCQLQKIMEDIFNLYKTLTITLFSVSNNPLPDFIVFVPCSSIEKNQRVVSQILFLWFKN